jgi:hypothetical protein
MLLIDYMCGILIFHVQKVQYEGLKISSVCDSIFRSFAEILQNNVNREFLFRIFHLQTENEFS